MRETLTGGTDVRDSDLVVDALWGDGDAIAAIHDRYVDEIHDRCWLRLRDREAAGEVTRATFVGAMEQLWQLREPDGLRDWLREVADRRIDAHLEHRPPSDETDVPADVEQHLELRVLLWDDAHGLTARDRRVLARHLGDGLDGAELARAIGVPPDACAGLLTRLRDRVNRTLGALVVARLARSECDELDAVLREWNTSVLARGRITSHVDGCERCAGSRDAVNPWSLLSAVPVVFASPELRDAVVHDMLDVTATAVAAIPDDDPPAANAATTSELQARAGRHRVPLHGGRPLLLSSTTRVLVAVLVAVGMTGGALLELSDAAWVTTVRNEARELGDMLAGDGGSPTDPAPADPAAPPVPSGANSVAGGPGTTPGGAASETTGGDHDRGAAAFEAPPAVRNGGQAPPTNDGAGQPGEAGPPAAAAPERGTTGPPAKLAITGAAAGLGIADAATPLVALDTTHAPRAVTPAIPAALLPDAATAARTGEAATSTAGASTAAADEDAARSGPAPSAGGALAAGDAAGAVARQADRAVTGEPVAEAPDARPDAERLPAREAPDAEAQTTSSRAEPASGPPGPEDAPDASPLRMMLTPLLSPPEPEAEPAADETPPEPAPETVAEPAPAPPEDAVTSGDDSSRKRSTTPDDASVPDDDHDESPRVFGHDRSGDDAEATGGRP
jgi:DNA-directed RNA polymerase specialized sigma24 family protein